MAQVLPGHRRTVVNSDPLVQNGLHFALAAVVETLRNDSSSLDLVTASPARSVGLEEGGASMLLMAATGGYFAHMHGLCERTRLRSLSSASDVEWLLEHPGCPDQFSHITAHAL